MADLRCDGLTKSVGGHAVLSGIDLHVAHGTLTAILGASGSGKTTLLRVVVGFIRADGGTITVGERIVAGASAVHIPPERRGIGFVAQDGALFPHLTVGQNVGYGLPREQRRRSPRITEVLELVGLDATYLTRHVHEISGGEQRRVALARALAPRPQMILLDEPFSGLDAGLRRETRRAVMDALEQEEATAVLVTHDQAEALSMGRQVAVLRHGRLEQTASPDALYWSPVSLEVARFVGDAVVVPGTQSGSSVQCVFGRIPVTGAEHSGEVLVVIRPEQIAVVSGGGGVPARIVDRDFQGPDVLLRAAIDESGTTYLVTLRAFSHSAPAMDEAVHVAVDAPVVTFVAG